jgi:hypothetical protein
MASLILKEPVGSFLDFDMFFSLTFHEPYAPDTAPAAGASAEATSTAIA